MKKFDEYEKCCSLCEHSEEVFGGDYYICKKKGVVEPDGFCRAFRFDPLMIRVSVQKIPEFKPFPQEKASPPSKSTPQTKQAPIAVPEEEQKPAAPEKEQESALPEQETRSAEPTSEIRHKYHVKKKAVRPTRVRLLEAGPQGAASIGTGSAEPKKRRIYRFRKTRRASHPVENAFSMPEADFFTFSDEMAEAFPEDLETLAEDMPFLLSDEKEDALADDTL